MSSNTDQGGYYAIKGFAYQIDKALIEILDADDSQSISVENIQDIDSDNFVIQVKYRETQDYGHSKIREPVLQLIEEFEKNPDKKYILYCHFNNKIPSSIHLDIDELNKILKPINGSKPKSEKVNQRIHDLTDELKAKFIQNFEIIYSQEYQEQFEEVINKIITLFNTDEDNAVLYYSWMDTYISNKIVGNPNADNRNFTKEELCSVIHNGKNKIFNTAYEEYLGHEKYLAKVKNHFIKPRLKYDNFIIIGDIEINSSVILLNLINDITDNYFHKATYDIRPLIFVVDDVIANDLKVGLINKHEKFNDGYESIKFNESLFFEDALIYRKVRSNGKATDSLEKISFKIRLITKSSFETITSYPSTQKTFYLLDEQKTLLLSDDSSQIAINNLDSNELLNLFTQ